MSEIYSVENVVKMSHRISELEAELERVKEDKRQFYGMAVKAHTLQTLLDNAPVVKLYEDPTSDCQHRITIPIECALKPGETKIFKLVEWEGGESGETQKS